MSDLISKQETNMKGYKAFEHDLTCRGFQYEIGKEYETDKIEICKKGFHFCKKIADCFNYYPQTDVRFAEVEAYGEVIEADDDSKCVTNKIRILREIPREEAVDMSNTGNWNTGNWNTGYWNTGNWNTGNCNTGNCNTGNRNTGNRNTGNCNTGNRNTGNCNTGNRNTGDWNIGDWNTVNGSSGCFCTEEQTIKIFDKDTDMTLSEWRESEAYGILWRMPEEIDIVEWVYASDMTDEEKEENPSYETTGGYLKVYRSNVNKQDWWNELPEEDKAIIKAIPNFDANKFYKCTGIRAEEEESDDEEIADMRGKQE